MKKKLLAILICLMCLSIVGCEAGESKREDKSKTETIKKNKGNDIQTVQKTNVVGEWELYDYDIGCYRNVGFACSNCHTEYGNEMFVWCLQTWK